MSVEFDVIDADASDAADDDIQKLFTSETEKDPFALLRIMTTANRFFEFTGSHPRAGDWYFLELEPKQEQVGLVTWHSQLEEGGYVRHSRGLAVKAYRLYTDEDGPTRPRSLSCDVSPRITLPTNVARACQMVSTPSPITTITTVLATVATPMQVCVRDVGQASYVTLLDELGSALLHFDVGFPISFNGHTRPKHFGTDPNERPLIVLSHWDWDHLHAAFSLPHLRECTWVVPSQRLGPGAARLATMLSARGNLLVWPTGAVVTFPAGMMMDCTGPAGIQNDTGLVICTRLASGRVCLLTGDADYQWLPAAHASLGPISHLVATHHGARVASVAGQVPPPAGGTGRMVVSYGRGNVYRHPHQDAIQLHAGAGWRQWSSTAGRRHVARRGDRYLD